MDIREEDLQALSINHHGLVAALCKELGIAEKINKLLGNQDPRRIVSSGQAIVAMILNGLGFTDRRLYLTHQFFAMRPTERLLEGPIKAQDITDYTLGHTLDEVAKYGASKLFGEIAFEIALEHNLLTSLNHLDTTSLSVHGRYDKEDPLAIKITHGHSKDHRPDLKQAVLSLVVNGASSIPLWMEPLDGNSSDKKSFHETIKKVKAFQKQIDLSTKFKWVADAALYSSDKLLKQNDYLWICRVPETILGAKTLCKTPDKEIEWTPLEKGYKTASFTSHYGGIEQRWLLVFSEQAYEREKKTLDLKLEKQANELDKKLWHLGNEVFNCEKDAKTALKKLSKKYPFYHIESQSVPVLKYAKRGKPKAGEEKVIAGYKLECQFKKNEAEIEQQLHRKGRFILGTNDLDKEGFSDAQMLKEYKEQQYVENGFRFLKDPWFMVDSVFLKKPSRIEALMMVMTLCLLVYNVGQHKLRTILNERDETLPNQLGKQIKNPTMRWIFQIMEGVGVVQFYEDNMRHPIKEIVTNLNELRKKIIRLFGHAACHMHGLAWENSSEASSP